MAPPALSAVPAVSVAMVSPSLSLGPARGLPLRHVAPDAGSPRAGARFRRPHGIACARGLPRMGRMAEASSAEGLRGWVRRMRWRRRGAWLWPVFALATIADTVLLHVLPIAGNGPTGW